MRPGERTLRLMLAPLAAFLDGPQTNEIVCQIPGEVGVETAGVWAWHDMPEMTADRLAGIATLAAAMTRQDVDASRPSCATVLPDGQRVQVMLPPLSPFVTLSIRCPPRFKPTLVEMHRLGAFADTRAIGGRVFDWSAFFADAVREHKTIIVSGATGSGKTTVARAIGNEIAEAERLIVIEDTPELALDRRNLVPLLYSKGDQGVARTKPEDLIEAAMRMRPDRILMGELRDGAAWTFMRSGAAGHPGSITTCHARSARGAFDALRLMVKQHEAGRQLADADILATLENMVDIVAHCEKRSDGSRGVTEVFIRRSTCSSSLSSAA